MNVITATTANRTKYYFTEGDWTQQIADAERFNADADAILAEMQDYLEVPADWALALETVEA